jgi:hypothetical protein
MKKLKFLVVLLAFVGFFLNGCSDNSQSPVYPTDQTSTLQEQGSLEKCTVTQITAAHYPVSLTDPGSVTIVGNRVITKRLVMLTRLDSENPLCNGNCILIDNGIRDKNTGDGHLFGKWELTPDADVGGGKWEGTWEGTIKKTGESEWTSYNKIFGLGKGGSLQGMQLFATEEVKSWDISAGPWYGELKGFIKSHKP